MLHKTPSTELEQSLNVPNLIISIGHSNNLYGFPSYLLKTAEIIFSNDYQFKEETFINALYHYNQTIQRNGI